MFFDGTQTRECAGHGDRLQRLAATRSRSSMMKQPHTALIDDGEAGFAQSGFLLSE